MIMGTTLTERIAERKAPEPTPIEEHWSPFVRKLRAKQLEVRDMSNDRPLFYLGCYVPKDDGGAA